MKDERPGLNEQRLISLARAAIERCRLDLTGAVILTEAATGAYSITPVLAAMAGARRVFAITRPSHHGSVKDVISQATRLAGLAGVSGKIVITTRKTGTIVAQADIITNSGHVRPIDAQTIAWMKREAVISLMYEAWELRSGDVDLKACEARGLSVAGTNERHPMVDVFAFLGVMAIKQLFDAGVAVYSSHLLVLCDNAFGLFLEQGLRNAGAMVDTCLHLLEARPKPYDAILVALQPQSQVVLDASEAAVIAQRWPGAVVVQFWGDIDRTALLAAGVPFWPIKAPASGHMGVLPSEVGPEPVVRLQAGGLKVGEMLWRRRLAANKVSSAHVSEDELALVQAVIGHKGFAEDACND